MPPVGVHQDFQALVLACNKDGMDALRQGQSKAAFDQFKYAESILIANQMEGDNTSLNAVTCNNLGCYYKKVGKLHGALSYLRRALKMEVELNTDEVTLAGTHLNICAILSQLEKHEKAVQHALSALELIKKRISTVQPEQVTHDDYSVLAIAYHNVAVERDYLREYDKAAIAFQEGHTVAKKSLGEDHPLSVTLGRNCDAVLAKSHKVTKAPPSSIAPYRFSTKDPDLLAGLRTAAGTALPPLQSPRARTSTDQQPLPIQPRTSVRRDAEDWVKNEEAAWTSFAQSALGGTTPRGTALGGTTPRGAAAPLTSTLESRSGSFPTPRQVSDVLRESQSRDIGMLSMPKPGDPPTSSQPRSLARKTNLEQALEEHPEALMDIVDAERTGHVMNTTRIAPNDYRPNRMMKGATRTSRMVRRTGTYNSTRHRDHIAATRHLAGMDAQRSEYVKKIAAERIQRAWRAYYRYCQENADWMTTTWICATMIQAHWRSYHVRRVKLDKAATTIQRTVRGHLVRKVLREHQAAVTIQRHVVGMLTRKRLMRMHRSAVKIQALVRGGLDRKYVRRKRALMNKTALTIQCAVRCWFACRLTRQLRVLRDRRARQEKAALDIQRVYRGHKGRQYAEATRRKYMQDLIAYECATRIQAVARRKRAEKRVDAIRAARLDEMAKAAILLRRRWLGSHTRRRYQALLRSYSQNVQSVITIQRYTRGFLVRLRLWREACRAEEELWAALELQRVWRGYKGRVKWEHKFEDMWRREMAAAMIARNIRGWCARRRVGRTRRRLARIEFERARVRFRAAQRIQALARGVLTRKITRQRHARAVAAATHVQRVWRGHKLRKDLWEQVLHLRATMIQAAARGFIVRRRRLRLLACVICVQRNWRQWRNNVPDSVRRDAAREMRERNRSAAVIQRRFRSHQEDREIGRIHQVGRV